MDILVASNNLNNIGGAQNYAYAIVKELLRLGHTVEYFTFNKGLVSGKIEELGVQFMSKPHYDLIIANHKPVVMHLFQYGFTVQTSHGIMPGIEEPSCFADHHVCVSKYQQEFFLAEKNIQCQVIANGVDCERFYPITPLHEKLSCVLSLCQSEYANVLVKSCCKKLNVKYLAGIKNCDNIWDIENLINKADLVIGVGRSLYDAMACGRTVISYDTRYSDRNFEGDGYLDRSNVNESLVYNCCGGASRRFFTKGEMIDEMLKYNSGDGAFMREFALKELNIANSVKSYLAIDNKTINTQTRDAWFLNCYNEMKGEFGASKSPKTRSLTDYLREIKKLMRNLLRV